ncbi:MAG: DUF3540 domain-containing protein [Panacagrimonas sp.]
MTAIPIRSTARRSEPVHLTGEVLSVEGRLLGVRTEDGVLQARRAASCLLRPECGDRVLVSGASATDCYVIAVLERAGNSPQCLHLVGDASLSIENGSLQLESTDRLDLNAVNAMSLGSNRLDVRASKAQVILGELSAIGRAWSGTLGHLRFVGEAFDSVVQRLTQHARHSVRTVEQSDQVRCGEMDYRAQGSVRLHGQHTHITASELVKLDGDQIHLG